MVRFTRRPRSNRPGATVSLGRPGFAGGRSRLRGSNPYLPRLSSARRRPGVPASRRAGPRRHANAIMNISPGVGGQTYHVQKFRPDRKAMTIEKVGALNTYSVSAAGRLNVLSGYQNSVGFDTAGNDTLQIIMGLTPVANLATIQQYALQSVLAVLSIANNSSSGAHMDVYDVIYKRSTPRLFTNATGTSYPNANANDLWKAGMQDQDTASLANAWQNLLVTPTASRTFNDYCKIVRKKRILLAAGATHEHRVSLSHNKLVSTDLIGANTFAGTGSAQTYLLSGYTHTTLIVAHGNPASASSDTGTVVSTAPLAIDIVYSAQYRYMYVQDKSNTTTIQDGLSSFAPGVAQNVTPAYIQGPVVFSP